MRKKSVKNLDFPAQIPIIELILFCIFNIQEKKETCTFERLVKECFTLFPKAFSLMKYLKWPDARKLDRPLRILRKRKLINGGPDTFFTLTEQGRNEAAIIEKILFQKKLF